MINGYNLQCQIVWRSGARLFRHSTHSQWYSERQPLPSSTGFNNFEWLIRETFGHSRTDIRAKAHGLLHTGAGLLVTTMQLLRLWHSLVALCMVLATQCYAYVAELHDSTKPNQVCSGMWADNNTMIDGERSCCWQTVVFNAGSTGNATVIIFEANDFERLGKKNPERNNDGEQVCLLLNLVYRLFMQHYCGWTSFV